MVQVSIFPFLTYHLCLIFGKMDLGRKSCGYSLAYILFSLVLRFLWVRETNTYCIILGFIILRLVPVKNEKRKCKRILKLLFKNYVLSLNRNTDTQMHNIRLYSIVYYLLFWERPQHRKSYTISVMTSRVNILCRARVFGQSKVQEAYNIINFLFLMENSILKIFGSVDDKISTDFWS